MPIILLAALLLPPPPIIQTTHIVNGINPVAPEFSTISAAVAASAAGDTILIKGLVHNGQPVGYSEHQYQSGNPGEDFPIKLLHSLTISPFDPNDPVLIWSSQTATVKPSLFKIPASVAANSTIIIKDLTLIGAMRGIHVEGSPQGITTVLIKRINFDFNRTGLLVEANESAKIDIAVRSCKLVDTLVSLDPNLSFPLPPNYRGQAVGLAFHGTQVATPGEINGEVYNLRLTGNFTAMNPNSPPTEFFSDAGFSLSTSSRIIEIVTSGHFKEFGGTSPISEVNLEIDSCVLDGKASSSPTQAGWDVGIYATAIHPDGVTEFEDFTSGYRITVPGTEITDCRLQGIHCESDPDSRGEFWLQGGSEVTRTGRDLTPPAGHGEGIRMHSNEGYIALHTQNAKILDNLSHGISAEAEGSNQATDNHTPVGVFFDINNTSIHENDGDGIRGIADQGAIGGTWNFVGPGGLDDLYFSDLISSIQVDHGQGVINSCDISNNGGYGVYLWVVGSQVESLLGAASVRLVNNFIWNHPLEGIRVDLQNGPFCFVPIVHCTIAGNGDSATTPQSIEIVNSSGSPAFYRAESVGSRGRVLNTKIYNSIFQRKSVFLQDFGSSLDNYAIGDSINNTNPLNIGCAGIRALDPAQLPYPFTESNGDVAPFVGPIIWIATSPAQFFFGSWVTQPFNHCPNFLHVEEGESNSDFEGTNRPSGADLWKRDKGGDHADDS